MLPQTIPIPDTLISRTRQPVVQFRKNKRLNKRHYSAGFQRLTRGAFVWSLRGCVHVLMSCLWSPHVASCVTPALCSQRRPTRWRSGRDSAKIWDEFRKQQRVRAPGLLHVCDVVRLQLPVYQEHDWRQINESRDAVPGQIDVNKTILFLAYWFFSLMADKTGGRREQQRADREKSNSGKAASLW